MKKFLLKLVLLAMPAIIVVALYFVLDPLKVVYHYDDYLDEGTYYINVNYPMVMVETLENAVRANGGAKPDAFFLGDSRSVNWRAAQWEKYLPENSRVFHFDSYNATLPTILASLDYLDRNGYEINHALLTLDNFVLERSYIAEGYLFTLPSKLGGSWHGFHLEMMHTYLAPSFLDTYLKYQIDGLEPGDDAEWYKPSTIYQHLETNELDEVVDDRKIAEGINTFPANSREEALANLSKPRLWRSPVWTAEGGRTLREIAAILDRHDTDYHIVIPMTLHDSLTSPADVDSLKAVFSPERVHRMDTIPVTIDLFYDLRHFNPAGADLMMRRLYQAR